MNSRIADQIQHAVHHFQNGNLENAEQIINQILAKQPRNSDALHLLGVINAMRGKPSEAATLFKKALSRDENNIELHANLAKALCELGRFEEALPSYRKVIRLGGGGANMAGVVVDHGTALRNLGRYTEALACYEKAVEMRPGFAEAWTYKGNILHALNRHDEAISCHDKAISINPRLTVAWTNKGTVLDSLKKYDEALLCYDQAIALSPANPQPWLNRGITLRNTACYLEALASYDKALSLNPNYAHAWNNRGVLLAVLKRHDEALANYAKALSIDPDFADAHDNEGILRLSLCDFETGWHKYEWRKRRPKFQINPYPDVPEWQGEITAHSILVWAEQGIGDQILYSGMIEGMKKYTDKLMVSVDPRLIPLFERSFAGVQFLPHDKSLATQVVDRQIAMGSIGKYLRKNIGDFSRPKPEYLVADGEKTGILRRRIKKDSKLVCGLSWVSKNETLGSSKSLALRDLMPILSLQNLSFVDLQYGDTSQERRDVKNTFGVDIAHLEDIDTFNDIDSLASLIDACDFVVTISNTTTHLAGAIGKKTLLMAPFAHGKMWYWHEGHANSLWYPSVRIFTQAADGDWGSVITDVVKEIGSI